MLPPAVRTERMAELRLAVLGDVALQLAPLPAPLPDALAEPADREHALEHMQLAPLPCDVIDHLGQREQHHHVYRGVGKLQRPGAGHVPDVIEEGKPDEGQCDGECRAPGSSMTPGGY